MAKPRDKGRLTDVMVKQLHIKDKIYREYDSDKLYLQVEPNGSKLWRVRYSFNNRENMLSVGVYPTVGIGEARAERNEINKLLSQGIDPADERRRKAELAKQRANTFQQVADLWLEDRKPPVWSLRHFTKTKERIANHLTPFLGNMPIKEIFPTTVLPVMKRLEKQGKRSTAHTVFGICSQIFKYAVGNMWVDSNPCRDLEGALAPVVVTHFAAITKPLEVGKLLLDIDSFVGTAIVHCALRLSPLLFLRPTELRMAEWEEFNWKEKEWRIPASRMKMKEEHIVPLSRQALVILDELKEMTGHGKYLFPSVRRSAVYISDGTVRATLRRLGYSNEQITPHGFRSTASTLLNELGWEGDVVERQLAHAPRNKVRATYNRAQYLKERREVMQVWADYLDELKEKAREEEKHKYIDNILK